MDHFDYSAIGQRIKTLRKRKGLNQQELASILGKSLRTVQKYETGEIEVSVAIVNELAKILDTTPTFLLGYETDTTPIRSMADIVSFLFKLDQVSELDFRIDVKKPPHYDGWSCAISFDGKNMDADYNADICLFLEQWEHERDNVRSYLHGAEERQQWENKTIAYYASSGVTAKVPEELTREERIAKRMEYLNALYAKEDAK